MINFLLANEPVLNIILLNCGYAFSQYVVKRAGVFSVATSGFGALGAYAAGILTTRYGAGLPVALIAGLAIGLIAGVLLSLPLARLRGVYQAIATLAFVQIIYAISLYAEGLTAGAQGLTGIPRLVDTGTLLVCVAFVIFICWAIDQSRVGRAFDAIRQDETVASSLGISIAYHHIVAFAVSGAIGGMFGALQAMYVFSIDPSMFGFHTVVAILTYVLLGGRGTILGPIVGATIMTLLPEVSRPLAENSLLAQGVMLVAVINFLPEGLVDNIRIRLRRRRAKRADTVVAESAT